MNTKEELKRHYFNRDFNNFLHVIKQNPELIEYAESLIIEKRKRKAKEIKNKIKITNDLKEDILQIYKEYFGIELPRDGKLIFYDGKVLIIDWFNDCPVLNAILRNKLDSRIICKKLYERPVQVLLDEILPYKVIFTRNYGFIRPYHSACREIYLKLE